MASSRTTSRDGWGKGRAWHALLPRTEAKGLVEKPFNEGKKERRLNQRRRRTQKAGQELKSQARQEVRTRHQQRHQIVEKGYKR